MRAIEGVQPRAAETKLEVLWVGDTLSAVDALERLGLLVTHAVPDQCADYVASHAPDMVVLSVADLSRADAIASELRRRDPGATIPIITVSPGASQLEMPQRRAGIVARFAAELAPGELAAEIHERLQRLASKSCQWEVSLSPSELDTWLLAAARDGCSGFLFSSEPAAAVALASSGQVVPAASTLREALARAAADEPKGLKFWELPPSRLLVLGRAEALGELPDISGTSVVVIHPDLPSREALSKRLTEAGAEARAVGTEKSDLEQVSSFAPTLLVIAATALGQPWTALLWQDARLSSVSFLVVDESTWDAQEHAEVVGLAAKLIGAHKHLQQRLARGELIVGRIENFGTPGWLKEVGRCAQPLTLLLRSALGRGELTLAEGKIREAKFVAAAGGEPQTGRAALQASLAMPFGRVLAGPREAVMAFEASPPLRAIEVPRARVEEADPETDASDFQERPTAARAASVNPSARRSLRPAVPEATQGEGGQPSAPGTVVPLKPSVPAPRPRASAIPPLPAAARKAKTHGASRASVPPKRISERPAASPPRAPLVAAVRDVARPELAATSGPAAEPVEKPLPAAVTSDLPVPVATAENQNGLPAVSVDETLSAIQAPAAPSMPDVTPLPVIADLNEPPEAQLQPRHGTRWLSFGAAVLVLGGSAAFLLLQRSADARTASDLHSHQGGAHGAPSPVAVPPRVEELPAEQDVQPIDPPHAMHATAADSIAEPADRIAEPADRLAEPADRIAEPADRIAEPADRIAGPSGGVAEPSPAMEEDHAPGRPAPAAPRRPAAASSAAAAGVEVPALTELVEGAKAAREQSRHQDAEAMLKEALSLDPNHFGATYQLALTLVRQRRFEEGHALLDRAIELKPDSPLPLLLQGDIYLQQGLRPRALSAWRLCLEVRPEFQSCTERLARWSSREGDGSP